MAAAAGSCARLAAWGGKLRRGLAVSRQAVRSPGPLAAAVAGAALAGAGAAWHHSRVNVAARDGSLTVSAQVRDELLLLAPVKLLPPLTPFGGEWFGAGRLSRSRGWRCRCDRSALRLVGLAPSWTGPRPEPPRAFEAGDRRFCLPWENPADAEHHGPQNWPH